MIDVPAESICIHGDNPNSIEALERSTTASAQRGSN
ncbi:hypothetical protein [Natronococcus sp. A-GB7]|nr:hypothetical protein [Natronococcus sp. A-GB7]MDG5820767.1 hypothetical protein [Natronococcus sp. A-GB7]